MTKKSTPPHYMFIFRGKGEMSKMSPEEMQQSFQQQFGRSGSQMQVVGQESVTIRGQPVTMTLAENDASPKLRQAVGTFKGKNGLVIVMVMGTAPAVPGAVHWV